jgi:hypothetical protein
MPMKNSSDTIWNRSRDPTVCSTVFQPLKVREVALLICSFAVRNTAVAASYKFKYVFSTANKILRYNTKSETASLAFVLINIQT